MSRFWEIVFCVPLLFRRHVYLSNLKHAPSCELPLTAQKTMFSHLNCPSKMRHWYRASSLTKPYIKTWKGLNITPTSTSFGLFNHYIKTHEFSPVKRENVIRTNSLSTDNFCTVNFITNRHLCVVFLLFSVFPVSLYQILAETSTLLALVCSYGWY